MYNFEFTLGVHYQSYKVLFITLYVKLLLVML